MEYDIGFIIVLFLIGIVGSALSGMVGIGVSIIKLPMLLYILRYWICGFYSSRSDKNLI